MTSTCTPHKSVQWATNDQVNEFAYGSPYSEASSTDSINASSTLQYINSQLIAHGFTRGSGVSFEGLSKDDADKLSKCMLGMLSQRNEDMSRVEDLSTKLRTLSYEHERLASIHRSTSEQLAASERETNMFKSRLAAANKSLQASEAAHKATSAELQKARVTVLSIRQTHAAELKRREKDTEKLLDRWQKIADGQTKLGSIASGIKFKTSLANSTRSMDDEKVARGQDVLEDALDEAQAARKELLEENTSLKNVVLSAANELSRLCHAVRTRIGDCSSEEALRFGLTDLFSVSAPENASEKFNTLLSLLRGTVTRLGVEYDRDSTTPFGVPPQHNFQTSQRPGDDYSHADAKEILRLQNTIVDLRRQLEQAQTQKEAFAYADQAQAIIKRFLNVDDERATVQEKQLLEKMRKELDYARRKVDEAALALRDEKAALEEEKDAFYREQSLWRSQMGITHNDGPPKQPTGLAAYFEAPAEPLEFPTSPPRHSSKKKKNASPRKQATAPRSPARPAFAVGKVKKARAATPRKPNGALLATSMFQKVIPPMETEVMQRAPALPTTASGQTLIVPDSFVLPPPSPFASIPPNQSDLLSKKAMPQPYFDDKDEEGSSSAQNAENAKRSFPVAKPLAEHMIHAYSPARPSPLSRILQLGNSPAQRVSAPHEDAYQPAETDDVAHILGAGPSSGPRPIATMMLEEEELDLDDLTEESPLRAKNKRLASKGKSSAMKRGFKAKTSAAKSSLKPVSRETDKENGVSRAMRPPPQMGPGIIRRSTAVKPLVAGKGGARRVPIGSADAAPIGPGWK